MIGKLHTLVIIAACLLLPSFAVAEEAAPAAPVAPAAPAKPQTSPLSLLDSINLALQNNPTVRIAEQQVFRNRAQVTEAKSAFGPLLGATVTHTNMGPIASVSIPTSTGTQVIQLGAPQTTRAQLALTLPLDISGAISDAVDISSLNYLASQFVLTQTEQNIALAVQESYLGVLRAQGLQSVADEAVTAAQENLRLANARFQAGTAAHFDVLRAEVQFASSQQNLVDANNAVNLAKAGLNRLMGMGVNQPLELVTPTQTPPALSTALEENQKEAGQRRPEVLRALTQVKAADKGVRLAHTGILPSLAIIADQNYDTNPSALSGLGSSWDINAALSIPIYDRGRTHARVNEARSDAQSARLSEEDTRQQVMLEVRQAYLDIQAAEERLKVAEKDVEQAQEALRLAQLRYKAGLGIPVEVIDAEVALTQSRTNRVNAFYDLLIAHAQLDKAIGNPLAEMQK